MAAYGKPRTRRREAFIDLWVEPLAVLVVVVAALTIVALLAGGR